VVVFIKGVVHDVRSYEKDKSEIQAALSHEFLFFEDFKAMFFDDGPGQDFYRTRPRKMRDGFDEILRRLQEILGEYKAKGTKYGLIEQQEEEVADAKKFSTKEAPLVRFKRNMAAQLETLKKSAIHWAIFDKSAILGML